LTINLGGVAFSLAVFQQLYLAFESKTGCLYRLEKGAFSRWPELNLPDFLANRDFSSMGNLKSEQTIYGGFAIAF
jgi:hypothetical protein